MLSQKSYGYYPGGAKRKKKQVIINRGWYALKSDSKKEKAQDTFSGSVSVKSWEMEFREFGTNLSQNLGCQNHKLQTMAASLSTMQTASQVVNAPALLPHEST